FKDLAEQEENLFKLKSPGNRCSCKRTKFPVESVNIKTDKYFLRQSADDLFCDHLPVFSFEYPVANVFIEISNYPFIAVLHKIPFTFTVIADAHLYQFLHFRNFIQRIIHDAGMRVIKAFLT